MNKCEKCGFLHYRTDPCRKPKKSTAARKDVRAMGPEQRPVAVATKTGKLAEADGVVGVTLGGKPRSEVRSLDPAGTQALPVDTNNAESPNGRAMGFDPICVGSTPASASSLVKTTERH